jgi:hypothetical protein
MKTTYLVIKNPGEAAKITPHVGSYRGLQDAVGGTFQEYSWHQPTQINLKKLKAWNVKPISFTLWVNDEGWCAGLQAQYLAGPHGAIAGPIVAAKHSGKGLDIETAEKLRADLDRLVL